jgi:hypothetical protein
VDREERQRTRHASIDKRGNGFRPTACANDAAAARAEPPEVTASENPVLIGYPHLDKKIITLGWDLAGGPPGANLIVEESGTPVPVHNQWVTGSGMIDLTVFYGKTYTAKLELPFVGTVGEPLTITTDKPHIEMTCAQRCIKSIDVQPHGGWAQFTIATTQTAVMTLEASTSPPNSDGKWSDPGAVAAFAGTVAPTDHWVPPLANLQANTTYHYVVRAHVEGHEQVKTGTFKTLARRVEVNFTEIQMIEDSDAGIDGDCDCVVHFVAGDEDPKAYGSYDNRIGIASDTTVHPNVHFTITNAPGEIRLGADAEDDDHDFYEICMFGHGPPLPGKSWESSFSNDCQESAGNQVLVALARQGPPWAPGDVDEQFTDSFTINVSGPLVYNVRGTYKVSYVA